METEAGEWFVAYRTLQSISRVRRPNVSWRVDGPLDDADGSSGACVVDAVDEVDDECFHTSDFEPFSDDDEDGGGGNFLLVAERAIRARLNRRSSASDIGQLDYSLFEPLRSGAAADDACGQNDAGSSQCSGLLFLLCRTSASSKQWDQWYA